MMCRPILFVLFMALLTAGAVRAEEPPQAAPEPEKKPDAFQYFFGPKEKANDEEKKEGAAAPVQEPQPEPAPEPALPMEAPAAPVIEEQPAPPAAATEPVAEPVPPAPQATAEAPQAPEPPQAKPDAFQYFFGRSAEAQPKEEKAEEKPAAEPVKKGSAFEYFFGEKREEKKETAERKPPR